MKREKKSRDVLKAALYIVRGQPRRERQYRDAVEEILGAGGVQCAEYTMRGGEKARAYLPGAKGKTGNPTASKVEAIDALERLGYVKTIPGRGQVDGKRAIERFIRRKDPHGTKSKYFVKMDVRHCYQNLTRRAVMRRLRRDVHKNPVLLWFVDALLSTFQHGFSIGSFLSQFLCNYMLSYAYHFATEQLYKIRKRRTGRAARVRLVGFVLFYMDDILFIGAAFKDVKKAARLFCAYLRDELGLEIKPIWHVKALAKEPIDIMGFVIRRDRTTVRARIFVRARRQFLRAWAYLETGGYITIKAARRIISYRGYFSHTDSVGISAKLHIVEVSRAASNVISAAARAELAAAA